MPKTIGKALVFPKGGQFKLQRFKPDGTLDPDRIYTSLQGIVKTVQRATTVNTSSLPDGNSVYAAKDYVTSEESIVTIGLSTYDPELEAFVKDAIYSEGGAGKTEFDFMQAITVPETLTVVLNRPVAANEDGSGLFLKDKFGNVFDAAETAAAGKYSIAVAESTGVATLTFAETDKDKELYLVGKGSLEGVATLAYSEDAKLPAMQVTIIGETMDFDETRRYDTNIVIDKATLNGGITPPTQSNDPTAGWEFALKTGKPRAGKKPMEVKFVPKA